MPDAPASVREIFARAARRIAADVDRDDPFEAVRYIKVRWFAGPAPYADSLSHLRIAHLTDLHVGRVTPTRILEGAVALANAASPDAVMLTGDYVCHSQHYLDELTHVISGLRAPVFAVLGNHDHWSGADAVRAALRRAGACVLDNQNTSITLRGQRLQVVGLDDAYTGHADRERAVRGLRRDVATIALSHIAEEADGLWRHGVPLVLSGHTHAGQITVARLHEISIGKIAGHKYVHGLYGTRARGREGAGAVYVGAGIGAAVMPLRIGERARREVTIFELGAEPGSLPDDHGEQTPLEGRKPSPEVMARRRAAVARKREQRERQGTRG